MTIYADYQRDRIGWFFGLSGGQLMFLAPASLPAFWAISRGAWFSAFLFALVWLFLLAITVIPVRGRSATGWVFASTMYAVGGLLGWTSFRAHATEGRTEDRDTPDLPGVLQGIKIHDGLPHGSQLQRVGVIHDDATKTWAVTASIVHPGIGMKDTEERSRYGEALAGLLDVAGRTEKIDEILFMVRPRGRRRARPVGQQAPPRQRPPAVRGRQQRPRNRPHPGVGPDRAVRDDRRPGDPDRPVGQGVRRWLRGRCRELYLLMAEIEAQLRGPMGMTSVRWHLAGARPGVPDRVRPRRSRRHRRGARHAGEGPERERRRPGRWPPSGADATVRHYSHDAWNSISATIKLPTRGVAMGALAPILTPSESGERRRSSSPSRSFPSPRPTGSPATPSGPQTWLRE